MTRHIFAVSSTLLLPIHFAGTGIGISISKLEFSFGVISRTSGTTKRMLIVPLGIKPA
jgi:hypothetical protein